MRRLPLLIVGLVAACSAGPTRRPSLPSASNELLERLLRPRTLPRYLAQAAKPAELSRCRRLPPQARLCVGQDGERWLDQAPFARLAPELAPEPLADVLPGPLLGFLGASGTVYEASSPLGVFVSRRLPPKPLVAVAAGGGVLLGLTGDARAMRSLDQGRTWTLAEPPELHAFSIGVDGAGNAVALAAPERVWISRDRGRRFSPQPDRPLGATAIEVDAAGTLWLRSVTQGRSALLERQALEAGAGGSTELEHPPAIVSSADDYEDRHALLLRDQQLVVRHRTAGWTAWLGRVGGPLSPLSLGDLQHCRDLRLVGDAEQQLAWCAKDDRADISQVLHVMASRDLGRTWYSVEGRFYGISEQLRGAHLGGTRWAFTGLCAPTGTAGETGRRRISNRQSKSRRDGSSSRARAPSSDRGCLPSGILVGDLTVPVGSTEEKFALHLQPSATPSMFGVALLLAAVPSAGKLVAVGRRSKTKRLALYLSEDRATSFSQHPLEPDCVSGRCAEPSDDQSSRQSEERVPLLLAAPEGGDISLVMARGDRSELWLIDSTGEVVSVSSAPEGTSLLGAYGRRALAVSVSHGDTYETLDGGASYRAVGSLRRLGCKPGSRCKIHCTDWGCWIGSGWLREGWGGSSPTGLEAEGRQPKPLAQKASLRTSYGCRFDEPGWHDFPVGADAPQAAAAGLGESLFYAVSVDRAKASVVLVQALRTGTLQRRELLTPLEDIGEVSMATVDQVEGVAALRLRRRAGSRAVVELGWANLVWPVVGTARFEVHGGESAWSVTSAENQAALLRPALLSVAGPGVGLQLVAKGSPEDREFFYVTRTEQPRSISRPLPPWRGRQRWDIAYVDGQVVPIGFAADDSVFLRGGEVLNQSEANRFSFSAETLSPIDPERFGVATETSLAYRGNQPGLLVVTSRLRDDYSTAHYYPIHQGEHPVSAGVSVPTQQDLSEIPASCSDQERRTTPRVVMRAGAKTRRGVALFEDDGTVQWLLTDSAVEYGTPDSACLDVMHATGTDDDRETTALVNGNGDGPSWVFRSVPKQDASPARVRARRMSCHAEPNLKPPIDWSESVNRALGSQKAGAP